MAGPTTRRAAASNSVSRNMTIALIGNAFPPLVALFSGPILAQALGVDGRGAVAAATAPLALVVTVATFGVPEAVTWAIARNPTLARNASNRGLLILVVAGLLAMGAVVLSAAWLSGGDPTVQQLILVACLAIVPNLLVGVFRGVASATQSWRLVALERIITSSLRLAVLIPFWITGTLTPLVATIAVAAMPVTGLFVYIGRMRSLDPRAFEVPREARTAGLLSYGLRIWVGSLSGILLSRLDQVLMTPFAGTYQLGLYVVAVSVSELPLIINQAVRDVTFVADAADSVDARLASSARISTMLCGLAALFLGISMLWWLPFLFGEDFRPALPVAVVLLTAVVLGTPGSIGGSGLSARGRPGLRSMSLLIACLVNIGLLILLAPPLGAMGAALATLAGNLISSNLNLMFMYRKFGINPLQFYGVRRTDFVTLREYAKRFTRRRRR
ncbi:MAG: oligosaccharide flippase family protein [Cryobacterium sp.]|uniref:oligosaccharide flippase family protein n=1 Tax=unclassified Cryobacterium TaxID=2649013 RepID=UPI0018CBA25D|nr:MULTISPECIES: oligosaccharide flippase family protein [unclassified Cryobacterium]MCY7404841.1 oligosaccharide flippase family protein [Cryobacterium sp.]MEC5154828.1 O-antigen/teichoic acid export membrane protein [Cryobacterium sp. CAN_C3]